MYQQQQPQRPKNPNGGYLKPSQYGADQWYGTITITPELLASIQQTGKLSVQVYEGKQNQYGMARRVIAKPYQAQSNGGSGGPSQPMQQGYGVSPQPAYQPQQNPMNQPAQDDFADEIPF